MPASATRLEDGTHRFLLQPNGSLSPAAASRFLWLTGTASFAIALYFTLRGLWPVLPFAGLEIGVLVWALRASMRASRRRESILVQEDTVRIERHERGNAQPAQFQRHWARVTLRAAVATQPSRLLIESHGRSCEVGRFLNEQERSECAKKLRRVVGDMSQSPPL
ncbi:MAG: DUF2244 domain-containing protein [Pseudomonadota bacterium]